MERYRDRHRDRDLTNALNLNRDINLTRSRRFPDPFLERSHSLDLIYALDQALDRARSLVLSVEINLDFEQAKIFDRNTNQRILNQGFDTLTPHIGDRNQLYAGAKALAERSLQVWCSGLGLDRELLNLSETEVEALEDYFYICELIIRCKESAVRVSREVWESIENAMVMPTLENMP